MERSRGSHNLALLKPVGVVLGAFAVTLLGLSLAPDRRDMPPVAASPTAKQADQYLLGRTDVEVRNLAGGEPGLRDGVAWDARFDGPNALALEPEGSLLVCDSRNHRIRRITGERRVETVVGGGPGGGPGGASLGSALQARLRYPSGVACDPAGTIYVADTGNHRICKLQNGSLSLLAGGTAGNRDGTGSAAAFQFPATLYYDPAGAVWVADAGSGRIRRVSVTGVTTTPAAAPPEIVSALGGADPGGERQIAHGWRDGTMRALLLDQGPVGRRSGAVTLSVENAHQGYRYAPHVLQLFADTENHVVMASRDMDQPFILAGSRTQNGGEVGWLDGSGATATFSMPAAVAWSEPVLYVADYEGNRIRRVLLPNWVFTTGEPNLRRR